MVVGACGPYRDVIAIIGGRAGSHPLSVNDRAGSRRALRTWLPVAAVLIGLTGCSTIEAPAGARAPSGAVEVDVIGDSLSTGAMTPGDPWTLDAQRLLQTEGPDVRFVNAAENGAGYLARGENGDTFGDEIDQVVSRRAQIVLFFGSDNDLGQSDLEPAVEAALRRVRALAPRANVIVIGPPGAAGPAVQQLEGLHRDHLTGAQCDHLRVAAHDGLIM